MSPDTPTAADVMRAMVAAFDTGDVDEIRAFVDAEYVDHQGLPGERPMIGVDGFIRVVEVARRGRRELSVAIEDLILAPDRVAARLAWRGVLPSGEITERETLEIVRIESGRAVEHWGGHSQVPGTPPPRQARPLLTSAPMSAMRAATTPASASAAATPVVSRALTGPRDPTTRRDRFDVGLFGARSVQSLRHQPSPGHHWGWPLGADSVPDSAELSLRGGTPCCPPFEDFM